LRHRAEWATIPNNLFTADVTAPFQLYQDGVPLRFDFVTAWEFLEHITQDDLPAVFENIDRHLAPEGLFLASVNTWGSLFDGIDLHQTIQPVEWWNDEFTRLGWRRNVEAEKHFETTWLRQDSGDFHVALERSRS
jgi:SAM-dependent methyltransferase